MDIYKTATWDQSENNQSRDIVLAEQYVSRNKEKVKREKIREIKITDLHWHADVVAFSVSFRSRHAVYQFPAFYSVVSRTSISSRISCVALIVLACFATRLHVRLPGPA